MSAGTRNKWGPPTWYFLHGFAEKINKEFYESNLVLCYGIIKKICYSLPCPMCRKHAITYLSKHNMRHYNTKEKLKVFLFNFHNAASKHAKNPEQPIEILDQYKTINMLKAWIYFETNFFYQYYSERSFNSWRQNSLKKELKEIFNKHWSNMFN